MGDVIRSVRDIPPLSYVMTIDPFSLLSKLLLESGLEQYESGEFKVGGYTWKMMLYPNGNKKSDVYGDYISVYLAMMDAKKLTNGSEVNVFLKFFILDQIKGKFITFEDGRYTSFNAMKNVRGISRMLSLEAFRDSANGYLIDDCCTFGVEVTVEPDRKGEKLTIIQNPDDASFSWKIPNFSTLKDEEHSSDQFVVGGFTWKLKLYPKGNGAGEGKWVSIYLAMQDYSDLRQGWKVYASYKLVVKDELNEEHLERSVKKAWFCASSIARGFPKFISQADMEDEKRGFIVNDTVSLEVEINFMSMLNPVA